MQEGPVQLLVQMQAKPVGFSTQVAPFMHGDDKHACSTDEGHRECRRDDKDAWTGMEEQLSHRQLTRDEAGCLHQP